MKVRHGDRRYRESFWRRFLSWILPERRDGWEQRARPVTMRFAARQAGGDRRHSQALSYGAVVDRRKDRDEREQAPNVPAIAGAARAGVGESAPLRERDTAPESGMEQEGKSDGEHISRSR